MTTPVIQTPARRPAAVAPTPSTSDEIAPWIEEVRAGLLAGRLAPYLGAAVIAGATSVPADEAALARFLEGKMALPKRARGNLWASAQYIESQRHRTTLVAWLSEAFAVPVAPTPFQRALGRLELPLIVDTWYDGAMRTALEGRSDWCEIQGASRAKIGEARWTRTYDPAGELVPDEAAASRATVLYKPHGSVVPARNFLAADSDYVETLTEIDIQTPIPKEIVARRGDLGFVFLGCRFHDQMLRTYARQIVKRSKGPHFVVLDPSVATRNERRFAAELSTKVIWAPLEGILGQLAERLTPA